MVLKCERLLLVQSWQHPLYPKNEALAKRFDTGLYGKCLSLEPKHTDNYSHIAAAHTGVLMQQLIIVFHCLPNIIESKHVQILQT